ncbi:hypothetical protein [Paenibacillus silvae]|uniref:Uncharacterized protein n=1 Tax=Paenibacillus silvae TaxID=1325358 RepID=A0A2W6NNQ1_9BACL|nr:hypothetical protein [Paenibacillus silvae]PZT57464.1 hypothetical protein DN757_02065 [Paenibacillus silvae]
MDFVSDVIHKNSKTWTNIKFGILTIIPGVHRRIRINFDANNDDGDFVVSFIKFLSYYKNQNKEPHEVVDIINEQVKKRKLLLDTAPKMVYKYWDKA